MYIIIEYVGWLWLALVAWTAIVIALNDTRVWRGRR